MRFLDKYLIYSSIISLFTEDFSFHYIIDWKLFYVILLSNFLLLSYRTKLSVNKNLLILLSFFLIHGAINYLLFLNPIKSLFAQFLGISISSIYFYNLIKLYKTEILFNKYLDIAFIIAVLAIPMYYLKINVFTYNRLNGILSEPAHYAAIMLPAIYLFLKKKKYFQVSILVITIFLSKSSIGFIGLLLMVVIPLVKVKYFKKYFLLVVLTLGFITYFLSSKWDLKIDENNSNKLVRRLKQTKESLDASYTGKFKKYTNLSSYAFLSNFFITKEILTHKPLGTGLGSYQYEYEKYYKGLRPPEYLITLNQSKINKTDANSLFLRIIADFGIFGLLMIAYFVLRSYNVFRKDSKVLQQGTFFYLTVKLIREGHYFPPEFYFFLLIFLKNSDEDTACS